MADPKRCATRNTNLPLAIIHKCSPRRTNRPILRQIVSDHATGNAQQLGVAYGTAAFPRHPPQNEVRRAEKNFGKQFSQAAISAGLG